MHLHPWEILTYINSFLKLYLTDSFKLDSCEVTKSCCNALSSKVDAVTSRRPSTLDARLSRSEAKCIGTGYDSNRDFILLKNTVCPGGNLDPDSLSRIIVPLKSSIA